MTDASAIITTALASLTPYIGAGGLVATVIGGAVAISRTLATTRLKRAEAAKVRAEAKSIEAQTESAQVQRGLVDAETIATALGKIDAMQSAQTSLAARLDDCERKHEDSERTAKTLRGEVRTLRREMVRRGWTPPGGFPAEEESEV